MGTPPLHEVLTRLQKERGPWAAKNFPDSVQNRQYHQRLGVLEEIGELAQAQLKEEQGIRGTAEEHQANAKDAIGDLTVFLAGVCDEACVLMEECKPERSLIGGGTTDECISALAYHAARLDRRVRDGRPAGELVGNVVALAEQYCKLRDWDYALIVDRTWAHVSKRDWVENKQDGGTGSTDDAVHQDPLADPDDAAVEEQTPTASRTAPEVDA